MKRSNASTTNVNAKESNHTFNKQQFYPKVVSKWLQKEFFLFFNECTSTNFS